MSLLRRPVGFGIEVMDLLLAAGLLALAEVDVFFRLSSGVAYEGGRAYNAALSGLLAVAVVLRRRWSLQAVIFVTILVCLSRPYVAHDASLYEGFLPLIVLTAGAAIYEDRRRSIIALAIAEAGLALYLSAEPTLRSVGNGLGDALFIALPWMAATILNNRSQQAHRLSGDLERTRAEQAAREQEILGEERARIARELHDVVAHSVSVMVVNIGAARLNLEPGQERARNALVVAEETGRLALMELRRLLGVLREANPPQGKGSPSPQPNLAALDGLAATMAASGLRVRVTKVGPVRELSPVVELNAYRIVQEALTNAMKHGKAAVADVVLSYEPSCLTVEVLDDGRAVSAGEELPRSGHGLIGARERASIFGGQLEAGRRPEGGWQLRARLPLETAPADGSFPVPERRSL